MASIAVLIVCLAIALDVAYGLGGNNTVTDEVFFDVKVETGSKKNASWTGRFVVGIFGDALPITTYNFIELAKGYKHRSENWHYKNAQVHMVVPDHLIQTGDVLYTDGRGGRAVYSRYFIDEAFIHSHKAPGYVGMVSSGIDMNDSQFYVTLSKARWMDNKNVIFGKVVKGMEVVRKIGEVKIDDFNRPMHLVKITNSGANKVAKPYDLTEAQLASGDDVRTGLSTPDEPVKKQK